MTQITSLSADFTDYAVFYAIHKYSDIDYKETGVSPWGYSGFFPADLAHASGGGSLLSSPEK